MINDNENHNCSSYLFKSEMIGVQRLPCSINADARELHVASGGTGDVVLLAFDLEGDA
jgi:hypothetical protein